MDFARKKAVPLPICKTANDVKLLSIVKTKELMPKNAKTRQSYITMYNKDSHESCNFALFGQVGHSRQYIQNKY